MIELHGHIDSYRRIVYDADTMKRRDGFLRSLKPGAALTVTMKRYFPKKSHQQVKTIWGLLIEETKKGLDEKGFDLATLFPTANVPSGIPCPREILMSLYYATCNDVGENGQRKTLSQMTTMEAATFFDNCRHHAARTWGILIPDPDPQWREKIQAGKCMDEAQHPDQATEGRPALDESHRWICNKCQLGYRHLPQNGRCLDKDHDGFPCFGEIVERQKGVKT